jgi:hypothetical protein
VDVWEDATEWQAAFREARENARRSFTGMLQKMRTQVAKGKTVWGMRCERYTLHPMIRDVV